VFSQIQMDSQIIKSMGYELICPLVRIKLTFNVYYIQKVETLIVIINIMCVSKRLLIDGAELVLSGLTIPKIYH